MQHERDMESDSDHAVRARDRCADMLSRCEKAYHSGLLLAVAEAVEICHMWRQPPPRWLVDAVTTTVRNRMTKIEKKRRRQNMIHYTRWLEVKELRARRHELGGMTWDECYAEISEFLEGTELAGSAATIKDSYVYVQGELKAGRTGPFLITRRCIDEPDPTWPTHRGG